MNEQVQKELKKIFNGRFSTSESTRANYARGEDTYDPIFAMNIKFLLFHLGQEHLLKDM